jgi:acetylornithine deacetylase/succinyl-diaminopimelate desuccinylase-like protein
LPSLTTSLRGLVVIECEVTALRAPVHSGMWGGAVVDPALALCRMLASLSDAQGRLTIPGIWSRVRAPTALENHAFASLPFDREHFASQVGMDLVALPEQGETLYRRLWREPALAINVLQCGSRGQTGNVVMDGAYARIGIRIVPDMVPQEVYDLTCAQLRSQLPQGVTLRTTPVSLGGPWASTPQHPIFELAREALHCGYGREAVYMGCGASIPFVAEMTAILGNVPALLLGVEDPECAAHSENESVHLGDLLSTIRAQTAFFGLLAEKYRR